MNDKAHLPVQGRGNTTTLIAIAISCLFLLLAYVHTFFQERTDIQVVSYSGVFFSGFMVVLLFTAAYGIGAWCLFFWRPSRWPFRVRFILSISLGLGILGFIILLMGAFGWLRHRPVLTLLGLLIFTGIPHYIILMGHLLGFSASLSSRPLDTPTILCVIVIALFFLLYLICSLPLPINYDVMEYHLGALEQSLREGNISPRPHLFYSYLPFGVETLYAAGLALENCNSYLTPKLINLGMWFLVAVGIYILAGLTGIERKWRLLAVILWGANRLVFTVGQDAFVEFGQTLYVLSALTCWFLWWMGQDDMAGGDLRAVNKVLYLSFFFWGLALGVKYSILGIGILPFMIILVPYGMARLGEKNMFRNWLELSLKGAAVMALAFSPWIIRNVYHTGNPFFPFLPGIFRWEGWTSGQMAYYMETNRAAATFSPQALRLIITKFMDVGPLYFVPILLALYLYRQVKWVVALAGYALAGLIFWNLIIHPPARFLVPLVPLLTILTVLMLKRLVRLSMLGILCLIPYLLFIPAAAQIHFVEAFNTGYIKAALFSFDQRDFLLDQLGAYQEAADFINHNLPQDARLLFLYEARTLYIKRPVTLNTVFDRSLLVDIAAAAPDAERIRSRLLTLGYSHVLVNEVELNRLIHTYAPVNVLEETGLRGMFQDGGSNLTAFEDLYGPYHFDERYAPNRRKVREFMALLGKRKIFARSDNRGLEFYIASLR